MKKIIALLLALIMTFSVATVAFATEGEVAPETETTTPEEGETDILGEAEEFLGDYAWILDLPSGTIMPALKIAKIALKFLKVYVKICNVFNLDPMETAQGIFEFISDAVEDYQNSQNPEETPEETTTAPAIA